jgi:hypothetical protein
LEWNDEDLFEKSGELECRELAEHCLQSIDGHALTGVIDGLTLSTGTCSLVVESLRLTNRLSMKKRPQSVTIAEAELVQHYSK